MKVTTKLDRLNYLHHALLECMIECEKEHDEWLAYDDFMTRIDDMIAEEHHRLGYMAVYSIVDGNASEELFNGTKEQRDIYADILLVGHQEMKGNLIIANI